MKNKTLTLPAIIIAIGLVVALVGCLLTSMQFKPAVTEQDFNYSVTYKIDGETKTFSGRMEIFMKKSKARFIVGTALNH